jgi:hypothetical protein
MHLWQLCRKLPHHMRLAHLRPVGSLFVPHARAYTHVKFPSACAVLNMLCPMPLQLLGPCLGGLYRLRCLLRGHRRLLRRLLLLRLRWCWQRLLGCLRGRRLLWLLLLLRHRGLLRGFRKEAGGVR